MPTENDSGKVQSAPVTAPPDPPKPDSLWKKLTADPKTIGTAVVTTIGWVGLLIIAVSLATGQMPGLARFSQGFEVDQDATISAAVVIPSVKIDDFRAGAEYKTFGTPQTESGVEPTDRLGDLIVWKFQIHGYAASTYHVYIDDPAAAQHLHLCDFQTLSQVDDDNQCAYWASERKTRPRTITVWLSGQDEPYFRVIAEPSPHPIAVQVMTLPYPNAVRAPSNERTVQTHHTITNK